MKLSSFTPPKLICVKIASCRGNSGRILSYDVANGETIETKQSFEAVMFGHSSGLDVTFGDREFV
jgi:hypothetical protein